MPSACQDNGISQRDIGEQIGLSAPAVQRRIRRLHNTGVIRANVAVIDPDKVGRPITLLVEVVMEAEKIDLLDAAKEHFKRAPEVQQCYYVTGGTDFILVIVVDSMHAYEELTRRLFFSNDNIRHFKTFVAMDRVKTGMELPLTLLRPE